MKLFEFTGITGCGKTTLLPLVKKQLRQRGLNVFDSNDVK